MPPVDYNNPLSKLDLLIPTVHYRISEAYDSKGNEIEYLTLATSSQAKRLLRKLNEEQPDNTLTIRHDSVSMKEMFAMKPVEDNGKVGIITGIVKRYEEIQKENK